MAEGMGFWVNSIKPGGPAEQAGLCKGDLIVTIDGRRPASLSQLRSMLLGPKSTVVDIGVRRRNSHPGAPLVHYRVERGSGGLGPGAAALAATGEPALGIGMAFKLSAGGGFLVSTVQPGGPADRAGVRIGDVICSFNGEGVTNKPGSYLSDALGASSDAIVRFGLRRESETKTPALVSAVVVRAQLGVRRSSSSGSGGAVLSGRASNGALPPSRDASGLADVSVSTIGAGSRASTPRDTPRESPQVVAATPLAPGARAAPAPAAGPRPGAYSFAGDAGGAGGYSTAYDSDRSDAYASSVGSYSGAGRASYRSDRDEGGYSSEDSAGPAPSPLEAHEPFGRRPLQPSRALFPAANARAADAARAYRGAEAPGRGEAPVAGAASAAEVEALRVQVRALSATVEKQADELVALRGALFEAGAMRTAMEELRAGVAAAEARRATAAAEAAEAERLRAEREEGREAAGARVRAEVERMRDEQDGMMDGIDEQRRALAAVLARVDARLAQEAEQLQAELNAVRAEVSAAIAGDAAAAAVGAAARPPRTPPLAATPTVLAAAAGDKTVLAALAGRAGGEEGDGDSGPLGRMGSPQERAGADDTMPPESVLAGSAPAPSPLVPRLRARQCVADDAVPASLRCASLVVGRRLFLFPKGRDGMCDMQYAMVMEVNQSLRMWALRVMGSLPLRCRCMFIVVKDSVCVFPTDSSGRCDLRQTFVLSNGEGERVYSQGCYVEYDTPAPCHCRCVIAGRHVLLFPHDGDENCMLRTVCALDTATLTLRVIAGGFPDFESPLTSAPCKLAVAVTEHPASPLDGGDGEETAATPVARVLCVPMTDTLSWRLDLGWVIDLDDGAGGAGAPACRPLSIAPGAARFPPDSGFVMQVVCGRTLVVAQDERRALDFGEVFAIDSESGAIVPVEFDGDPLPAARACQLFTVAGLLVVAPEDETSCLDLHALCVVDCGAGARASVSRLRSDAPVPPRGDLRVFVQRDVLLLLPYSCAAVSIFDPRAMRLQTFALDHLPKSSYGSAPRAPLPSAPAPPRPRTLAVEHGRFRAGSRSSCARRSSFSSRSTPRGGAA